MAQPFEERPDRHGDVVSDVHAWTRHNHTSDVDDFMPSKPPEPSKSITLLKNPTYQQITCGTLTVL